MTDSVDISVKPTRSVPSGVDAETLAAAERLRTGRWCYRLVKRAFDIAFSLAVLVGLSWLFLIVAVAIKLDDPEGPVIFAQTRVGRDGREFRMYKFRSMVPNADEMLGQLKDRNEADGPLFTIYEGVGHFDSRLRWSGEVRRRGFACSSTYLLQIVRMGRCGVLGPTLLGV